MKRRRFVAQLAAALAAAPAAPAVARSWTRERERAVTVFLAGDVMTGRGIDQVLPSPGDPRLHESFVKSAEGYVRLAEAESGPIPHPVPFDYVWGDALDELDRVRPDARIINLETSITTSDDWWTTKGIHYRMHPGNVPVLTAAAIDACVLANNHTLDWGRAGLRETLAALEDADIAVAGAGRDERAARAPAVVETGSGRLQLHAWGLPSAGVPPTWAASVGEPGVNVLRGLDAAELRRVAATVAAAREPGDRVVVSLHWGGNWGYEVPAEQRRFAHGLIDAGAADIVFGHSSHHPKGVELYGDRLILYGAGDFLNDYEGIGGREEYRGDLALMYFPELAPSGSLRRLRMTPMRIRRFRLERASREEAEWLARTLDRESRRFGTPIDRTDEGVLELG